MDKSYDAFITYRSGPDSIVANSLYEILRRNELTPALDSFDFSPAETFLDEMARCVRQSRYTIALISERYATSHFTQEEAIMQQILDNREKQRRLIVVYIEDYPAPLWMQSRVGVRLFQDHKGGNHAELKRLLKLLISKGEPQSPEEEKAIEKKIDSKWNDIPKQIAEFGLYGLAGYGALSAIAAMDFDAHKDVVTNIADVFGSEHTTEHATGVMTSIGRTIKNLIDDIW